MAIIGSLAILALLTSAPLARAQAPAPPPICDAPIQAGLQHCVHALGGSLVHVLIVSLSDPAVSFGLALPAFDTPNGLQECSSTRRCGGGLYPFETVPSMLARRAAEGAVAAINTDYFGLSYHPDHGAEGIAVRNGVRLDDALDPGLVGRTGLAISRDEQASLIWVGPRVTLLDLADRHYTVAGGGPQIVSAGHPLDNQACPAEGLHVAVCARIYHSAAGLTGDGRLVLATASLMDTAGLARFLVEAYGAIAAVKFDGGGSAQMAWLASEGGVTGFDASGSSDGGFRRVAEALLVYSRPLPRLAAADFRGIVVDDAGVRFSLDGRADGWQAVAGEPSIGGAFHWAANTTARDEYAQWLIRPGLSGPIQVYAFVPERNATTRAARYEVRHGAASTFIVVDQWERRSSWALLGEFQFAGDGAEYVRLARATGEAYATTEVAFDAIGLARAP